VSLRLYERFIKPTSKEPDQIAREIVLNYLLVGIFALALVAFADTAAVFVITHKGYLQSRLLGIAIFMLFVMGLFRLARYDKYKPAIAFFLMLLVTSLGAFADFQWGVLLPTGLELFGLAVVTAGILISARYSLYLTYGVTVLLVGLQYGQTHGYLHPDLSWIGTKPTGGDVVGFSAILAVIAFVSWLFNHQMELSLRRARRSEKALQRQKQLLEVKVEERTQQLRVTQLEQMRELYRFAELGRLSTALFHDLANHLTTVSVDIEGLKSNDQSDIMQRLQDNIRHVDEVVQRVRQQIQGKTTIEPFSILDETQDVIKLLSFAASKAGVTIELKSGTIRRNLVCKGDSLRFRQIVLNLISNGIEAYDGQKDNSRSRLVLIQLERVKTTLILRVTDFGAGIEKAVVGKIFEPFYSTKAKGVGIGLFIVKQVVQQDFGGTIEVLSEANEETTFIARLPGTYYVKTPSD
jgi:signal transduction histidine kinase